MAKKSSSLNNKIEKEYFSIKDELDKLRDEVTLKKWKLLSKAYKLGKQRWGNSFTRVQLSKDMNMPFSTVQRCLSLDRATTENWKKVEEGKISVFKLAMICYQRNIKHQNKIADLIIEKKLSTYQIKQLRGKGEEWTYEPAIKENYTRETHAHRAIVNWFYRGEKLLLMKRKFKDKKNKTDIISKLEKLKIKIDTYIKYQNERTRRDTSSG